MVFKIKDVLIIESPNIAFGKTFNSNNEDLGWRTYEITTDMLKDGVQVYSHRLFRPRVSFNPDRKMPIGNDVPGIDDIARAENRLVDTYTTYDKSYFELDSRYRKWVRNLVVNMGMHLANTVQMLHGDNMAPEAIVVRSGNVADVVAAAAANTYLFSGDLKPVPVFLGIGEGILSMIEWEMGIKELETFSSFGENPEEPANHGISKEVMAFLVGIDIEKTLGFGAAEFLRNIFGKTTLGSAEMLADVLPFLSGVLFETSGHYRWFDNLLELPSQFKIYVTGDDFQTGTALARQDYLKTVMDAKNETNLDNQAVISERGIDSVMRHARFVRLSPKKVQAEFLKQAKVLPEGVELADAVADLVYKDLAGLDTVNEIAKVRAAMTKISRIERTR